MSRITKGSIPTFGGFMARPACPVCASPFTEGDTVIEFRNWRLDSVLSDPALGHVDCVLHHSQLEDRMHPRLQHTSVYEEPMDPIDRVELILNRLRLNYLRAIALSPALRVNPAKALSVEYNSAFQSLVGVQVDLDEDRLVQPHETFWMRRGFDPRAKHDLGWEQDRRHLTEAIDDLFLQSQHKGTADYAECIAMKPGFHEAWLHDNFPFDVTESLKTPRGRVFATLRGNDIGLMDRDGLYTEDLHDSAIYLAYAPCAITQGPFVRRKHSEVSYFTELCRAGGFTNVSDRHALLTQSFHVLDSWQRLHDENNEAALTRLIEEAEVFVFAPLEDHPADHRGQC